MEALIAMVILAGVGGMMLTSFENSAKASKPSSGAAYNFGRGLMEQMYERVRQDQWGTASLPLSLTTPGPQGQTKSLNGETYTANYTVSNQDANADTLEDFRKVTMTVSW